LAAGGGEEVYDVLKEGKGEVDVDVVLDDRGDKGLGWKLKDAELIGYPIVIVVGRAWKDKREVEVQCRRLGVVTSVGLEGVKEVVVGMLAQL
jgi:prolyl-tRNA synthetase